MQRLVDDGPFSGYLSCGCINVQDEQRRCPTHKVTTHVDDNGASNYTVSPEERFGCVQISDNVLRLSSEPSPPAGSTGSLNAQERKQRPLASGVLDYFPDALMEVAFCSWVGNQQHNPGQPLHWAKEKSTDHADCIIRHLKDRGTMDSDGVRHSAKVAWRALALLQTEIENEATARR